MTKSELEYRMVVIETAFRQLLQVLKAHAPSPNSSTLEEDCVDLERLHFQKSAELPAIRTWSRGGGEKK